MSGCRLSVITGSKPKKADINMEFLKSLGIKDMNPGAYLGNGQWSSTTDAGIKESTNPSTGEVISRVRGLFR